MAIHPIDLKWVLNSDGLIDIFLLQWHTPSLLEEGVCKKIDDKIAEEKYKLLSEYKEWLINDFQLQKTQKRPLFIIAPELSVPLKCDTLITELVKKLDRPVVFIGGFEYLTWSEYEIQIKTSQMPNQDSWLEGLNKDLSVNVAGIWIGAPDGEIRKYIQPKSHPYSEESASIFHNNNQLCFINEERGASHRINFCVQICSDFASEDKVAELRKALSEKDISVIDITFLLQCNPDQEAIQFKTAVAEYFSSSVGKVDTRVGCLVFVNNANPKLGRSSEWGKSKFHFKRNQGWPIPLDSPQSTYSVENLDGAYDCQEIVMREYGPSIYSLTYKLRYLVAEVRGHGDDLPFQEGGGRCALIENNVFGGVERGDPFMPIPPRIHWIKGVWGEGPTEIEQLKEEVLEETVVESYRTSYVRALEKWIEYLGIKEELALKMLKSYLLCFQDEDKYPERTKEPNRWHDDVAKSVIQFLKIYSLLDLGVETIPGIGLNPFIEEMFQLILGPEVKITCIWGNNTKTATIMAAKYKHAFSLLPTNPFPSPKIIIIVNPIAYVEKEELLARFSEDRSILTAAPPENAGDHLRQQGDVVAYQPSAKIGLLYCSDIIGQVEQSLSREDCAERIARLLRHEI